MKYPMLNTSLVFKRTDQTTVAVRNHLDQSEYKMDVEIACFARKLNGKRSPYKINRNFSRKKVDKMLAELEEYELLRHSKILAKWFGTIYYTLWIPKQNKSFCKIAKRCYCALQLLWLPLFFLGLWCCTHCDVISGDQYYLLGCFGGVVIGAFVHECGHLVAGITHGAYVFEMGVMIQNFMPGAYILLSSNHVKSKRKRIEIYSAGMKANILLAGLCMVLVYLFPNVGVLFLCAAVNNIILALANVIFINGLDGASIIAECLGIQNIGDATKTILQHQKIRNKILVRGATGYATIVVIGIIQMIQLAFPLLLIVNILEVILWLF